MTTDHLFDPGTSAALRQLDPAGRADDGRAAALTPHERGRADATFERIVSSDPVAARASTSSLSGISTARPPSGTARWPRRPRRWWPVWIGVVAVAAALAVPGLVPGVLPNRDVAYASWTPKPVRLTPTESAAAVAACLQAHGLRHEPAAEPLIAERRGEWTYVLIPLSGDLEASCIMSTDATTDGTRPRDGVWLGGAGDQPPLKAGARHLYRTVSGIGGTGEGLLSFTEGVAGRDVVGVTITTPRGMTVVASVDNGRYAAWWPAGENKLTNPEISGAATFELTLRDGTTSREPPR